MLIYFKLILNKLKFKKIEIIKFKNFRILKHPENTQK